MTMTGRRPPDATAEAHPDDRRLVSAKVVVIDDHPLLAESVVMMLRGLGHDARSMAFDNPRLVPDTLRMEPDLVLLDLFLGDQADTSLAALVEFAAAGVRVLVVTATRDRILHARCIEQGAVGIIEKSSPIEDLMDGVRRALRSESVMSQAPAARTV